MRYVLKILDKPSGYVYWRGGCNWSASLEQARKFRSIGRLLEALYDATTGADPNLGIVEVGEGGWVEKRVVAE